ncbi:hypothetical protein COLO4_37842 [Corchorus olitorius]|uniref:Uncharacterized protein n=1 Tax=Corchorus olitorius TaxID=93759 RepID=A0A1R3FYX6_9ROSI|nr:hypothetical protein COLO4_37842 [Corchorus olitorius]
MLNFPLNAKFSILLPFKTPPPLHHGFYPHRRCHPKPPRQSSPPLPFDAKICRFAPPVALNFDLSLEFRKEVSISSKFPITEPFGPQLPFSDPGEPTVGSP